MTWAEILALFNFIAWILPIAIRTWIAWRVPSGSRVVLSDQERDAISKSISGINLGGEVLKIGDRAEEPGPIKE